MPSASASYGRASQSATPRPIFSQLVMQPRRTIHRRGEASRWRRSVARQFAPTNPNATLPPFLALGLIAILVGLDMLRVTLHTRDRTRRSREDGRNFWNQTFPAGLRWNATPGGARMASMCPSSTRGADPGVPTKAVGCTRCITLVVGHHTWEVDGVDVEKRTFKLGKGGWQEARYIVISKNPFYVEGAYAALDQP